MRGEADARPRRSSIRHGRPTNWSNHGIDIRPTITGQVVLTEEPSWSANDLDHPYHRCSASGPGSSVWWRCQLDPDRRVPIEPRTDAVDTGGRGARGAPRVCVQERSSSRIASTSASRANSPGGLLWVISGSARSDRERRRESGAVLGRYEELRHASRHGALPDARHPNPVWRAHVTPSPARGRSRHHWPK